MGELTGISTSIKKDQNKFCILLVKSDVYPSRSQIIRDALDMFLENVSLSTEHLKGVIRYDRERGIYRGPVE